MHPGDFIFGDYDGVVVVPHASVDEVLARGARKLEAEDVCKRTLAEGKLLSAVLLEMWDDSKR